MIDEEEIEALTRCFPPRGRHPRTRGWPLRLQVELEIGSELFVTRFMRMGDRRGEVVLALERPSGRLLLHRKAHYGDDTYRLLTGGIGHDEAIAAAAVRESAEETGLQVEIRRLVAVIDSTLRFGDIRLPFVSYVLHVVEAGGQLSADSHRGRRLSRGLARRSANYCCAFCGPSLASAATGAAGGQWRMTSSPNTLLMVNWELGIVNG